MIKNYIRPLSVAVIRRQDKILCDLYKGKNKSDDFGRLIGGGIEFLEKAEDALIREFKEELGLDIKVGKLLTVIENIFEFEKQPGHEVCFVYEAEFTNPNIYNLNRIPVIETDKEHRIVTWIDPQENTIYPINPKDIC